MSKRSGGGPQGRKPEDGEGRTSRRGETSRGARSRLNIRRKVRLWRRQDHVSAEPQWGWSLSDAVILAAAIVLVVATTLFAQEYDPPVTTLVTNMLQPSGSDRVVCLSKGQDGLLQGFRTGPNQGGYELTSILLYVRATPGRRYMTINAGR